MIKFLYAVCLCFCFCYFLNPINLTAQNPGDFRLQLPLDDLLSRYPSASIGINYQYDSTRQFGIQFGYVFSNVSIFSEEEFEVENAAGFKILLPHRWYFNSLPEGKTNQIYFEAELQYIFVQIDALRSAGFQCDNGNFGCNYYQQLQQQVNRHLPGINWRIGNMIYLNKRLSLDISVGIGVAYVVEEIRQDQLNLEPDFYFDDITITEEAASPIIGQVGLGFVMGYKF